MAENKSDGPLWAILAIVVALLLYCLKQQQDQEAAKSDSKKSVKKKEKDSVKSSRRKEPKTDESKSSKTAKSASVVLNTARLPVEPKSDEQSAKSTSTVLITAHLPVEQPKKTEELSTARLPVDETQSDGLNTARLPVEEPQVVVKPSPSSELPSTDVVTAVEPTKDVTTAKDAMSEGEKDVVTAEEPTQQKSKEQLSDGPTKGVDTARSFSPSQETPIDKQQVPAQSPGRKKAITSVYLGLPAYQEGTAGPGAGRSVMLAPSVEQQDGVQTAQSSKSPVNAPDNEPLITQTPPAESPGRKKAQTSVYLGLPMQQEANKSKNLAPSVEEQASEDVTTALSPNSVGEPVMPKPKKKKRSKAKDNSKPKRKHKKKSK